MVVDDHVAAYLGPIHTIVENLQGADHLEGDDVEYEDDEGVVAYVDEDTLDPIVEAVDKGGDVVGKQASAEGWKGQREELLEGGTPVHVGRGIDGEEGYNGKEYDVVPPAGTVEVLPLTEEEARCEEEAAHDVAVAALNEVDHLEVLSGLPAGKQQHRDADGQGNPQVERLVGGLAMGKPAPEPRADLEREEVEQAGHKKSAEEPEGSGQELVVAAHGGDDVPQALLGLVPGIGVGDATRPVAVLLVEQSDAEHQVVDDEEEERPLDEGQVEPAQALLDEGGLVVEVVEGKEIACCYEEERHVELIEEC